VPAAADSSVAAAGAEGQRRLLAGPAAAAAHAHRLRTGAGFEDHNFGRF
jgi:hypothetical protein